MDFPVISCTEGLGKRKQEGFSVWTKLYLFVLKNGKKFVVSLFWGS